MLYERENGLCRRYDKEFLRIEPWGKNALRVRATQCPAFSDDTFSALLPAEYTKAQIGTDGKTGEIRNGNICCRVAENGMLRFYNGSGNLLLEEYYRNRREDIREEFNSALEISPRTFEPHTGCGEYRLTMRFEAQAGEKLYGMGQYQQPDLDLKGCILELAHRNSQASVPFCLSNRGYGFLWNNPAIGQVTFGKNRTEWVADYTKQLDYWIVAQDTPAGIEEAYADATGKVPMMPEYGMGFWQCKLRYQTQEELLAVARGYRERNIPVDVIVADFFHWPHEGEWKFDPEYWPDPMAMTEELKSMGMELMVSIWPTIDKQSENYRTMLEEGMLVRSEYGKRDGQLGNSIVVDMTNPACREFVWEKMKKNYYDNGIRIFWLDEAEPELSGYEYSHYRYFIGADREVGNVYPKLYAKMAYDGMTREGQEPVLNLLRCAWAGSQRYGALVWSGDIDSSFRSLREQLAAGLNMGLAGIPWWTTDIGGFHGGNIEKESFRELLIRWFEFGTFCPVMRLHGNREPFQKPLSGHGGGTMPSGAANEIWSYGAEAEEIMSRYIRLRERMRPYIRRQMQQAHEKGTPVIRPLFYDCPQEERCWEITDEYFFGPDVLVCPILYENQREREVYLPKGGWKDLHSGIHYDGGTSYTVDAPLDIIPVFVREGRECFSFSS